MARGRTYELKAVFSAENKAGKTIKSLEERLEKLNRQVAGMKDATITFHTGGDKETAKTIDDIDRKIDEMEKRATIRFEAKKEKSFLKGIKDAEDAGKRINKMRPTLMIGAHDDGLKKTLVNDEKLLEKFTKKTREAMLTAEDEGMRRTAAKANEYLSKVWEKTREARLVVQDNMARKDITALTHNLDQLEKDRVVAIRTDKQFNKFRADLGEAKDRIDVLTNRPFTAEVKGKIEHFNRAMKDVREQLDKEISRQNTIEVRAHALGFKEVAEDARKAAAATQAIKDVKVKIQEDGLQSLMIRAGAAHQIMKNLDGTYKVKIDASSAVYAKAAFLGVGDAVRGYTKFLKSAQPISQAFAQRIYVAQQAMQVFSMAVIAVGVAALPGLVAGLTIATASLGAFAAGFGLIALAARPIMKHFQEAEQNANELESAEKALVTANEAVRTSSQGVADAQRSVSDAYRSGRESVRSAIDAHKDAVQGVNDAQQASKEAARGVREAEVAARQQIVSAVQTHEDAVRAVADAQRSYKEAVRGIAEAERAAHEGVQSAIQAHRDAVEGIADAYSARRDAVRGVAEAERSAHESVRSAIDAHRSALQGVEDAQEGHADAQAAARDATREVTLATQAYNTALATEQFRLRSMNLDIQGMRLSQKQLAMDMGEARREIMNAETPREQRAAELRYQQMQLQSKQNTMDMTMAQRELNSARKNGTDELQTAAKARQDAIKAEKEAQKGVVDAMRNLTEAQRDATKAEKEIARARMEGNRQIAEAQRGVAEAQKGILDAMRAEADAQKGIGQARKDGARQVRDAHRAAKDAHRGVAEAMRSEREAQKGITTARREGNRSIKDAKRSQMEAQRAIGDAMKTEREAHRDIGKARADAQRQVADAQRQLAEANRQLLDAQRKAADAQAEVNAKTKNVPKYIQNVQKAVDKFGASYNKHFKEANRDTGKLAARLINIGERALPLAGQTATNVIDEVQRAITGINRNFRRFGVLESIKNIFNHMPRITGNWTRALGNFGGAFLNIMSQAMPYARRMSEAVRETSRAFLRWSDSEEGRRQIKRFFDAAGPVAQALWTQIKRIGGGLIRWATQSKKGPERVANWIEKIGDVIVWAARKLNGLIKLWEGLPGPVKSVATKLFLAHLAMRVLVGSAVMRGLGRVSWWFGKWLGKMAAARLATSRLGAAFLAKGGLIGSIKWFAQRAAFLLGPQGLMVAAVAVAVVQTARLFGYLKDDFFPTWARGMRAQTGKDSLGGAIRYAIKHPLEKTKMDIRAKLVESLEQAPVIGRFFNVGQSIANAIRRGLGLKPILGEEFNKANEEAKKGGEKVRRTVDEKFNKASGSASGHMRNMNKNVGRSSNNMQDDVRSDVNSILGSVNKDFPAMNKTIKDTSRDSTRVATKEAWDLNRQETRAFHSLDKDMQEKFKRMFNTVDNRTEEAKTKATLHAWAQREQVVKAHTKNTEETDKQTTKAKDAVDKNADTAKQKATMHAWNLKQQSENAMTGHRKATGKLSAEAAVRLANNTKKGSDKAIEYMEEVQTSTITVAEALGIAWEGMKKTGKKLVSSSGKDATELSMANMTWAAGGIYRDGEKKYAAGGKNQGPTGGVSAGTTRVYGEVPGTTEYYITDNPKYKKRNIELLQQANAHMMKKYAVGGILETDGRFTSPYTNLRAAEAEAAMYGPERHAKGGVRTSHPVPVRSGEARNIGGTTWNFGGLSGRISKDIVNKVKGISRNTYVGHPGGERNSVDYWGGRRGRNIPKSKGDEVVRYSLEKFKKDIAYYIWQGKITGWGRTKPYSDKSDPHFDHVHQTYKSGSNLGGASGTSGPSVAELVAKHFPKMPNYNDGLTGKVFSAVSAKIRDEAIAKLEKLAPSGGGGSWDGGGNLEQWVKEGLGVGAAFPASKNNIKKVAGRARQESGGDPKAVNNWDSNAKAGTPSKGLMQVIKPTWEAMRKKYGGDIGPFDPNWDNPIKSVAAGTRWMKHNYGHIVGANGQGYSNGGIAMKPQVGMLGDRGPEVNVPLDNPRAVTMMRRAFDMSKAVTSTGVHRATRRAVNKHRGENDGSRLTTSGMTRVSSADDKVERAVERMQDRVERMLERLINKNEELASKTTEQMMRAAMKMMVELMSNPNIGGDIMDDHMTSRLNFRKELTKK